MVSRATPTTIKRIDGAAERSWRRAGLVPNTLTKMAGMVPSAAR